MPDNQTTILTPRRLWCSDCGGDGCIACECTGDSEAWRKMTMSERAAERDRDLAAMLRAGMGMRP